MFPVSSVCPLYSLWSPVCCCWFRFSLGLSFACLLLFVSWISSSLKLTLWSFNCLPLYVLQFGLFFFFFLLKSTLVCKKNLSGILCDLHIMYNLFSVMIKNVHNTVRKTGHGLCSSVQLIMKSDGDGQTTADRPCSRQRFWDLKHRCDQLC